MFCSQSAGTNSAENALIAYMEKNKDWCGVPDEALASVEGELRQERGLFREGLPSRRPDEEGAVGRRRAGAAFAADRFERGGAARPDPARRQPGEFVQR